MKRVLVLVVLLLGLVGCGNNPKDNPDKLVSFREVKKMYDNNDVVIIDVRTVDEYKEGHIEGAINIPLDDINQAKKTIDKDENVVVYCQSGKRSSEAKKKLIEYGFKNVYDLGSIKNWIYDLAS